MNSFGITDRGKVRRDNQDSFLIERMDKRDCLIAALCDGMGGEKAGNIASSLAAKAFIYNVKERLLASTVKKPDIPVIMSMACTEANNMVYGYSCFDSEYTGMGTTIVGAVALDDKVYILNVGDSRAYRVTKSRILQVTHDHSLVQEMVDSGKITPEEALTHPRRNEITRALGVDAHVPCDVFMPKLLKGDRILLCSDGLTNMLADEEILKISKKNADPFSFGNALMKAALDLGARDNVTVVIISK